MDDNAARIIDRELDPGEELLWAGRPRQGVVFTRLDFFLIPFSLLWGGFAIAWETIVLLHGVWPFAIFGSFFVVIGLYMMIGRFFVAARKRAHTYYGLTNERVLIISGKRLDKVQSKRLKQLDEFDLEERRDGNGTIEMGRDSSSFGMSSGYADAGWPMAGKNSPPRFAFVDNVRDVYQQIRAARRALETGDEAGSKKAEW
ncbi:MAG: hypothetical protein ACLFVJ_07850 [Persicimonas sp.]